MTPDDSAMLAGEMSARLEGRTVEKSNFLNQKADEVFNSDTQKSVVRHRQER
jgi:hypothetical protein